MLTRWSQSGALILSLISSLAWAAPTMRPAEVRERIDREYKALAQSARTDAKKFENQIKQSMLSLSRGKVSTTEIDSALKKSFSVKEDGINQQVNLREMAQTIEATRSVISKINRSELDPESAELVKQLERAIEVTPRFLALAALTSRDSGKQNQVEALAKEIYLIRDVLSSMRTEEAKSHLDVMELALEIKMRQPELAGDEAFVQALKDKYGDKAKEKLDELLKCVR